MEADTIRQIVDEVMATLTNEGMNELPGIQVGVSARHVHLSPSHVEALFGTGSELTPYKPLSQPEQFAANEMVTVVGPKGSIHNVRILGPARGKTQVEVAMTDALKLGVTPPVRNSGNLVGSSPVAIVGPKGSIYVSEGMIIANRHVHMHPQDAKVYGVKDGDQISLGAFTDRPVLFESVLVRVNEKYRLDFHIDTDEANACMLKTGDMVKFLGISRED